MIVYTLDALASIYDCKSRVAADFAEQAKTMKISDGAENSDYARGRSDAWSEAAALLREYIEKDKHNARV